MIRLRAHAKLNLALRVGPPAADGYHPVATILQTISLCDLLYAEPATAGSAVPASAGPEDPERTGSIDDSGFRMQADKSRNHRRCIHFSLDLGIRAQFIQFDTGLQDGLACGAVMTVDRRNILGG